MLCCAMLGLCAPRGSASGVDVATGRASVAGERRSRRTVGQRIHAQPARHLRRSAHHQGVQRRRKGTEWSIPIRDSIRHANRFVL